MRYVLLPPNWMDSVIKTFGHVASPNAASLAGHIAKRLKDAQAVAHFPHKLPLRQKTSHRRGPPIDRSRKSVADAPRGDGSTLS